MLWHLRAYRHPVFCRPASGRQQIVTAGRWSFWRQAQFVLARSTVTIRCVAGLLGGAKQTLKTNKDTQNKHKTNTFRHVVAFSAVDEQWFFFSRNIGHLTPKMIYFHYLIKCFPDQSIQKTFYLILKKEALWMRRQVVVDLLLLATDDRHKGRRYRRPSIFNIHKQNLVVVDSRNNSAGNSTPLLARSRGNVIQLDAKRITLP